MARRPRRSPSRGFTLIELLVSLAAGLIIAIAVAGLAKVTTNTFYEESRVQVAELSLRIAADRLRNDIARAAYMSTSNLLVDPLVAKPSGQAAVVVPPGLAGGLGLLAGVRYLPDSLVAGDDPNGQIATLSANNLNALPDRIVLGGNMTTADEYIVQSIQVDGRGCGGTTVTLSVQSPAISRLVRRPDGSIVVPEASVALAAAFVPVVPAGGAAPMFMARIVDDTGKRQFVALCAGDATSMEGGIPRIFISPQTPVLTAQATGAQGGTSGFGVGRLTINPVQLVEWSVRDRSAATAGAPNWARDPGSDAGTKFDLVREFLTAQGARVGAPELVAEYIVDFEIGLVVENAAAVAPPRMQLAAFDLATDPIVTQHALPTAATATGPQWIRSLRYRMATRAPMADRTTTIARPGATTGYAYRYCTVPAGCTNNPRFARVRTLTGEVTLSNQSRYP